MTTNILPDIVVRISDMGLMFFPGLEVEIALCTLVPVIRAVTLLMLGYPVFIPVAITAVCTNSALIYSVLCSHVFDVDLVIALLVECHTALLAIVQLRMCFPKMGLHILRCVKRFGAAVTLLTCDRSLVLLVVRHVISEAIRAVNAEETLVFRLDVLSSVLREHSKQSRVRADSLFLDLVFLRPASPE